MLSSLTSATAADKAAIVICCKFRVNNFGLESTPVSCLGCFLGASTCVYADSSAKKILSTSSRSSVKM
nr:MAG TPA: hypothetical protein [Bacteriophage sp.]